MSYVGVIGMQSDKTVSNDGDSAPTEVEHNKIAIYLKRHFLKYVAASGDIRFRRCARDDIKELLQIACSSYENNQKYVAGSARSFCFFNVEIPSSLSPRVRRRRSGVDHTKGFKFN